ncbi:hypothetical protein JCM14469_15440 [Desulfatiferula olefinivorans]
MEILTALFIDPLREAYFQKALLGGCLVAAVSGVLGCLVVLRKMAFLGDALSHAMIAGVAGGYLFMKILFGVEAHAPAMLIGSLIAAVLTVGLIGFVSRVSRIKEDTAIGIMYTGVFAGGVVLVSVFKGFIHIDLMHFIMGDVLGIADMDLWMSGFTAALVLSVILLFFRHFQLASFDPIMAASIGFPILLLDYALTVCVSLVVVTAVSMVGVILVVGLLITPAASAYLLSDRLDRMMMLSALFGVTSVIGGLYVSVWADSAGGGAIMLFCTAQFLAVMALAPRYGLIARWLTLRRMVPQPLLEDILCTVWREGGAAPVARIKPYLETTRNLTATIRSLVRDGLLAMEEASISLTEAGKKEALRIMRAHRLWETYLSHVGTAMDLHEKAHKLEHIHDHSAMDYLDDLLGHPMVDFQGKAIPERILVPGETVPLSMLRDGRTGTVDSLPPELDALDPGRHIHVCPREEDGRLWVVQTDDGARVKLDHDAADRVLIRIDG